MLRHSQSGQITCAGFSSSKEHSYDPTPSLCEPARGHGAVLARVLTVRRARRSPCGNPALVTASARSAASRPHAKIWSRAMSMKELWIDKFDALCEEYFEQ